MIDRDLAELYGVETGAPQAGRVQKSLPVSTGLLFEMTKKEFLTRARSM